MYYFCLFCCCLCLCDVVLAHTEAIKTLAIYNDVTAYILVLADKKTFTKKKVFVKIS